MADSLRTIDELDVDGRRVLLRADFNVPLYRPQPGGPIKVADDARIRAALETIAELRARGARLVLVSHLGRPKGIDPALSMAPVADRLAELIGAPVTLAPAVIGPEVVELTEQLASGEMLMLENIRYEPGETRNDPELVSALAELADVYVNDAFGTAHRAHASTEGIAHWLPSAAGRLMEREVRTLQAIVERPDRPLVAILGGAKVSDKIGVVERFLELADVLCIGGAMCFPFLAAQGHPVGASLCPEDDVESARRALAAAARSLCRLELPIDLVARARRAGRAGLPGPRRHRGPRRLERPRHRTANQRPLRRRDRGRRHRVLERPDGPLRARAVCRRNPRRRRGSRVHAGPDRGRRWRDGRGGAKLRPGRSGHPSVDRRRCDARVPRGLRASRRPRPDAHGRERTLMAPSGPELTDIRCACLIVLDGWGIAPPGPGNAIDRACKPGFDRLWADNPHAALEASGPSVGLPDGQMGNSEVGHLTLGAGAVVPQTLTLIDTAVADGALAKNPVLRDALSASDRVHLLGMVSDGGVHSGFGHLHALIELAAELEVRDLVLHCFTDGRDTSPTSGEGYLATLEEWCRGAGAGRVATVVGRYWAMDRDRRWERTQDAYDLLVHGRGAHHALDGRAAARAAYERGETDEFIGPTTVGEEGRIRPGDSVLCFNFRPDRMRQIVRALAEPDFGEGTEDLPGWRGRGGCAPIRRLATMTEYQDGWPLPGRVRGRAPRDHARSGDRSGRRAAAARGRDREVRARDLLLQRRARATV